MPTKSIITFVPIVAAIAIITIFTAVTHAQNMRPADWLPRVFAASRTGIRRSVCEQTGRCNLPQRNCVHHCPCNSRDLQEYSGCGSACEL